MVPSTSQMKTKFDYQEFRSLSMSDLVDYMEPIVNDPETAIVDPSDLRSVAADLESFDEYHLVYAIELGINFMPALFALPTAQLLTHRCQSVRLAAHRGLLGLTSQAISDDVINACQAAIASGAPIHEIGDLPGILRDRLALTIV